MRILSAVLLCGACCWPTTSLAARHTSLVFSEDAYAARYSQGINATATLSSAAGVVPGSACQDQNGGGQPCRVQFSIAAADTPDDDVLLAPDADPALSADGNANKRIVFVDGVYNDVTFATSSSGTAYVLQATFLGFGNPTNAECAADAPDTDDGDLCPATATAPLVLTSETPTITLTPGREGALGDSIDLFAAVSDATGEAALASTDVDGSGAVPLAEVTVRFYYDRNNNARPDGDELIGTAITNNNGDASLPFSLDPTYVEAGTFDTGIHAEFSGDTRYGIGRASTRLVVRPAALDVDGTLLEITPDTVPADNIATVLLRARLVDIFGNPLDETSDGADVVFATTLGVLVGNVVRDPNNGTYTQELRATRKAGEAKVTLSVNGTEVATDTVTFVGEGCSCQTHDTKTLFLAVAALLLWRRRTRPAPRRAP